MTSELVTVDTTPISVHRPDGAPKGAIVVIQEAFGVNEHIEDVAGRFAALGWFTVVPHLFHRTGDPTLPYDDFPQVMPHMKELRAEQILADVDAALSVVAGEGIDLDHTGVVGFCMGGTVTLAVACRRDVGAAVTFYGSGIVQGRFGFEPLLDEVTGLRAPWLGLYGDLDQGIPVDQVEQLRSATAATDHDTEVVRYPEAGHGFHCDRRSDYEPTSAADAWARTIAWFDQHLLG